MKTKLSILITFSFLFVSCLPNNSIGSYEHELTATSIKFIHELDGKEVQLGECLSPDILYAIQIETVNNSEANPAVTNIEYTINGTLYNMSFSDEGISYNPIELVEGKNIVQLVETGFTKEVTYVLQDDFILVD
ncbi:MAG: hypothetical protein ACJA2M_000405 [Polaribacter sp.]|jgi:hypothetical protein